VLFSTALLATAGRFGYLVYVIDLWLWSAWVLRKDEPAVIAPGHPDAGTG
jgi:hypothetical protein